MLIPPVYNKQPLIQALVPEVWEEARHELTRATRVIFFGYSLPPADIEAEKLFHRGITGNRTLPYVEVINPDPASAGRYAGLVGSTSLRWFGSLDAFLQADPFA